MRTIALLAVIVVLAVMLAGCSGAFTTSSHAVLPATLADMSATGTPAAPVFLTQAIDMTQDPRWTRSLAHPGVVDEVNLTMLATNETGNPVRLRLYVSDENDLTRATLFRAPLLLEIDLPPENTPVHYDASTSALTPEASDILHDGKFYVYLVGEQDNVNVRLTGAQLRLLMRTTP